MNFWLVLLSGVVAMTDCYRGCSFNLLLQICYCYDAREQKQQIISILKIYNKWETTGLVAFLRLINHKRCMLRSTKIKSKSVIATTPPFWKPRLSKNVCDVFAKRFDRLCRNFLSVVSSLFARIYSIFVTFDCVFETKKKNSKIKKIWNNS